MEKNKIKEVLETLFFITDEPVTIEKLKEVFGQEADEFSINKAINELKNDYQTKNGPIELKEVAGGFQFATKPEFSTWVKKLFKDKTTIRLSQSAIETLSIIAYKQPVTRAEMEEIRGVDVISVLEKLMEKKFIKIIGRKETIGRPLLYATTQEFLRHFGLKSLAELPPFEELIQTEMQSEEAEEEAAPPELPEVTPQKEENSSK
ncbi:MAG: SMC-Scp complex subunit ScpB [Elusimicrobiota bacterium]